MLDHVSITVTDIAVAERFYDAIMAALGVVKIGARADWLGYGERCRPDQPDLNYLSIRAGAARVPAFGRHWCFKATDRSAVDAFWAAGHRRRRKRRGRAWIARQLPPALLRRLPARPRRQPRRSRLPAAGESLASVRCTSGYLRATDGDGGGSAARVTGVTGCAGITSSASLGATRAMISMRGPRAVAAARGLR